MVQQNASGSCKNDNCIDGVYIFKHSNGILEATDIQESHWINPSDSNPLVSE